MGIERFSFDAKTIENPLQRLAFPAFVFGGLLDFGASPLRTDCVRASRRIVPRNDNPEPHFCAAFLSQLSRNLTHAISVEIRRF
jgi:hypothetical protein